MSSESSEHQRDYRECKKKKLVKQPKLNIFAMGEGPGIETHPTGGARSSSHGIDFERELTMLWTYRAYRSGKEYTVAIEDERTGKFDDYCINIKLDDGTILQQFVQLKHSSQKSPKLTNLDLFPSKSSSKNVFDLTLYFQSFLKIKNCPEFELSERSKQRFILFTNRTLTFGGNIGKFEFCESMFEKERETEILNTDIFKFKDEFPGRDSLKDLLSTNVNDLEYVDQFLQNFYIAESQPDGNNVSELLKSELSNDFKEMHCENAYYEFYVNYLKWYTAKDGNKGTRLSHTEIKKYFSNIKHHVVKQTSFELMDPAANFYGRVDIIAKIREQLTTIPKSTSHVIDVSISGMSGVGKTEIARYYAKKYRDEYDYTLWLNASSPQTMNASFERLNDFLNIKDNDEKQSNAKISVQKEISKDRITKIYSFLQNYKCLLIFDCECDLLKQELLNHMRQYLPLTKCNDHHFIVTTQIRNFPCNFEEHLYNFSEKETLGFLKQNLNGNLYNNDIELSILGNCLSNVSLALQIATSYIKENDRRYRIFGKSYSVNNFLDEYQKEGILVLNYKSKDLANKSLITICELSIQSILNSKENERDLALQILYIIAHLQPDHISIKIFDSKKENIKFMLNAILILELHSLISVSSGHISIHRLIQDVLRAKLQERTEKMITDNEMFFDVDEKGRLLHSDPKEMIESGKYNKEYILLTGLDMFHKSIIYLNCASNDEQIITTNVIVSHLITFIAHCIANTHIIYSHLNIILYAFNFVKQYDKCLECIDSLKYISNNLKHYATVNDMEIAKFAINMVLTGKYLQVGNIKSGVEVVIECQNIQDNYKVPFAYILKQFLDSIMLLKRAEQKRKSFELLLKLYILFDEYTNFQNQRLSHDEIKDAHVLGILLQEHLKFEEASQVFETIRQQESNICQKNLLPIKENCDCICITLSLSYLHILQKKNFEARAVMLSAQKCIKVPCKDNEVQKFSEFFRCLCYLHYKCGNTNNSLTVLNKISNLQFPSIELSDYTINFRTMLSCLTATFLVIDKKSEQAVDVLISAIYNLLVMYKKYNILNFSKHIEFVVNDVTFPKVSVTHNQASQFELLLFNLIHLSYVHFGFEYTFAKLLNIEKSILENFGHTTEIYSYILMCKFTLYKREKKHTLEIQTWIDILKLWYLLSKDSDSAFLMFRLTLNKFLNEKHLGNYFDLVSAEQVLCTVKMAINDIEKSLSPESKIGTFVLKFQYFECLLLSKKYSLAEEWGLQFLSLNILIPNRDINIICAVHVKLALYFYKIKKETSEAIKILNKCIQILKNMVSDSETNVFAIEMTYEFRPMEIKMNIINEKTVNYELRTIQRVKCCIEKSKIYYEIGENSKGWDTLQDCMYKIHDFDVLNVSFIPIIKEILLHLIEVGETEKALQYINDKCKLDHYKLEVFGACELLRIKAKLQLKKEQKTDAIETLWKLWNQKLTIVSKTNIHSYRNIEFLDQIKNILLKLEYQLSWHKINNGITKSAENLYSNGKETVLNIELTFYIAFCNYLLGSYRECMKAIESVEKLLESCCNFKNEELDNIAFDSSILKQRCNVCLNSL